MLALWGTGGVMGQADKSGEISIELPDPFANILPLPTLWAVGSLSMDLSGMDYFSGRSGRFSLHEQRSGARDHAAWNGGYTFDPGEDAIIEGPHHCLVYSQNAMRGLIPDAYLSMQDLGLHSFTIGSTMYFLIQSELGTWAKCCKSSGNIRFQPGFQDAAVFGFKIISVANTARPDETYAVYALGIFEIGHGAGHPATLVGYLGTEADTGNLVANLSRRPVPDDGPLLLSETSGLAQLRIYADGRALPEFAHLRFPPTALSNTFVETKSDGVRTAASAFIDEIRRQGVPKSAVDDLDVARLQRHNIRSAGLALPRDADHALAQDLLMLHLDLRDDLDAYFRRAGTYFLGRFALQHAVVDEVYHQLQVEPDETAPADPVDLMDVLNTVVAIVGGYQPHINFLYNVCALALQIVEERKPVPEPASVNQSVSDLIREIQDDYLNISYGLEVLRDRNVVSVAALREWRARGAQHRLDTATLDIAINRVFRKQVWARLLQVGCRLRKTSTDHHITRDALKPDPVGYYQQVNAIIDNARRTDPAVVAVGEGRYDPIVAGSTTERCRVWFYRLELREEPLPARTQAIILTEIGFSRQFLWHDANIPVENTSGTIIPRPGAVVEHLKWPGAL